MQRQNVHKRLFNRVEIVIVIAVLGVTASSMGPRWTQADTPAPEIILADQLALMRTQILVYRAQHHGRPPGFPNGDLHATPDYQTFVAQMTSYTNGRGKTSASADRDFRFGPYLHDVPMNPFNQSASIRFIGAGETFPTSPAGDAGWFYQPSTGALCANVQGRDDTGKPFIDY